MGVSARNPYGVLAAVLMFIFPGRKRTLVPGWLKGVNVSYNSSSFMEFVAMESY
jgi:hypothetical protein